MGFSGDYDEFGNFVVRFSDNGVETVLKGVNSRVVRYPDGSINREETDKWRRVGISDLPRLKSGAYVFDKDTHKVKLVDSVSEDCGEEVLRGDRGKRQVFNRYTFRKIIRAGFYERVAEKSAGNGG